MHTLSAAKSGPSSLRTAGAASGWYMDVCVCGCVCVCVYVEKYTELGILICVCVYIDYMSVRTAGAASGRYMDVCICVCRIMHCM